MSSSISFIIGLIIGAAIVEIINILFSPLKYLINPSQNKEFCVYYPHYDFGVSMFNRHMVEHEIIVTKQFGKTININCPHYKSEKTEIKKFNGKKYLSCPYGKSFDSDNEENKRCPFV